MLMADAISEYLGIYLLVLSVPLVINVITNDLFLRILTFVSALAGLFLYQFSHFSLLEKHFPKAHYFVSILLIVIEIVLFLTQIYEFYFIPMALISLLFFISITYLAVRKKNYKNKKELFLELIFRFTINSSLKHPPRNFSRKFFNNASRSKI